MSDLEIDPVAVQSVRDKAVAIESLADRSVRQLSRLSADGVGPAGLVTRVSSFGEEWTRGMREVGVFVASIADSLQVTEETFEAVDEGLSATDPQAS